MEKKSLELLPLAPGIIPVDEWVPDEEDIIVTYEGKTVIMPFDRYITTTSDNFNVFYGSFKDSYYKKFNEITHYINYFLKYYDEDSELMLNYLHCKYLIDRCDLAIKPKAFINLIYSEFVTDTMYDKIKKMVEDNYRIDLAQSKESDKQYSESLEFTNTHAKFLLLISIFIKMLIPLVMHYINLIAGKAEVKKLIRYYKPLFKMVNDKENINLYSKLFHSIMTKVSFHEKNNPVIWDKYAVFSTDAIYYVEEFLDKNIIVDNVFKYVFNLNIISFNSVILSTQLDYSCIKNFGINLKEISTEKDTDGLSYLDKLEMNSIKIDENIILFSKVNIHDTIKRIKKANKFNITKDEIRFYMKNTKINNISKSLVFYYYSKLFGGFVDLNNITMKKYMLLMIIMKRKLAARGHYILSQLISANINGRINTRGIHNSKYNENIRNSPTFKNLIDEKYPSIGASNKDEKIIGILSTLINTQFLLVDYDAKDHMNQPIEPNYDTLTQEFLDFVNNI